MCAWHIAKEADVTKLWPVIRGSHVVSGFEELESLYRNGPWRIRVSDEGDAMLLVQWREHVPALAMKGVWAAPHRMAELIAEAVRVARAQGYESLISPLLPESMQGPYREAGMSVAESLVVLQGLSARRAPSKHLLGRIRRATPSDAEALAAVDRQCFEPFWRHGTEEWAESIGRERVAVFEGELGIAGYTGASIHGSACTLGRLGVAPSMRRHGIGRVLVEDVMDWATREGIPLISLCTQSGNEASRALYTAVGLVELEEPYALMSADVGTAPLSDTLVEADV